MSLHDAMMQRMGRRPAPLREPGLLESAVLKPQMTAYYDDADLVRQAALPAVGISQNQPYVDGNKRTAYIAALTLLQVNGTPFAGDYLDMARELEAVATRADSLDASTSRFEAWLRKNVG